MSNKKIEFQLNNQRGEASKAPFSVESSTILEINILDTCESGGSAWVYLAYNTPPFDRGASSSHYFATVKRCLFMKEF